MLLTFAAFMLLLVVASLWSVFAPVQRPAFNGTAAMGADDNGNDEDEEFESFAWEHGDLRPTEE